MTGQFVILRRSRRISQVVTFPQSLFVFLRRFDKSLPLLFSVTICPSRGIKKILGRNELCSCGSRKKYKKCCLKVTLDIDSYDRWRQTEGTLIPKLLNFSHEKFGENDFLITSWKEWNSNSQDKFNVDFNDKEQIYLPWYLFNSTRIIDEIEYTASTTFLTDRKARYLSSDEKILLEKTSASPFTFYQVVDISKNYSFTLRDVLRSKEILVRERSATHFVFLGAILFGRHVTVDETSLMMGMSIHQFDGNDLFKVINLRKNLLASSKKIN